jgi:exopolyphosphatase / guanosine-5'-triphosphate,3'-diphosphate pyrophosphatase
MMSPQRRAFIDIGTNTILCLIVEIRDTGRFRVLNDLAEIAGLGRGVDRTGVIGAPGEARGRQILQRYIDECKSLGVSEFHEVGTSALRDAANSAAVRQRWREALGLDVRVLSGAEEAAYSYLAVQRGLALAGRELLVIDIGGGSTEFIRGNDSGVVEMLSLNLGSVRLTERFLLADPVRAEESTAMRQAIDRELAPWRDHWSATVAPLTVVGIAGTFTTLAAIEKKLERYSHSQVHGSVLKIAEIRRQIKMLEEKSIAERANIVGLEPNRADVIFAGACLIEQILVLVAANQVIVSDQGVRYGLLQECLAQLKNC